MHDLSKTGRQYFDYRIEQMRSELSSWIPQLKELNRNFSPRRGKFDTSDRNKGNKRNQLSNNTPLFAKRILRSGMMTGITSPARPWFKLAPPDPDMENYGPVRSWLDAVQMVFYKVFAAAGLYRVLPGVYEEQGIFGTAAFLDDDDFDNVSRYTPFTVGEYMLSGNGQGKIDTFAREYELTVYQLINRFGIENVSNHVRELYARGNYEAYVQCRHIIEPNTREIEGLELSDEFDFRSVYYEVSEGSGSGDYLSVGGYREFPVMAPRWETKPGDTYGIGPGMDALGDAIALQVQEREKGKAVGKMVNPPTIAPSAMQNQPISLLPGSRNFSDDPTGKAFRAIYQVEPRVQELNYDIGRTEDRINRAFYVDLFMMVANDDRDQRATATEIAEKHEEKLLQLGPVLENQNHDLLDPLIKRTFKKLVRASEPGWKGIVDFMMIPPPPPELQGKGMDALDVEYVSILAQAQKMVSTGASERWLGFVGNMAALGKPEVLDKVKGDALVDVMARDLGVPNKVVNTEDEVAEIRKARAEQMQQQEAMARIAQSADAAKTLSETDTTGGNVLSDVLGVGA